MSEARIARVYAPVKSRTPGAIGSRMVVTSKHPRHPADPPHHARGEVSIAEGDGMAGKTWINPATGKAEPVGGVAVFTGDKAVADAINRGDLVVIGSGEKVPESGTVDPATLQSFDLNKPALDGLNARGIHNTDDLAAFVRRGDKLTEVPGIGAATAAALQADLEERGLIPTP